MKSILCAVILAAVMGSAYAADVGVSVTVSEPGFYGRIDLGDLTRPRLIREQPIVLHPAAPGASRQPLYLHVPPGHIKHWSKHCHEYDACDRPVYFVDEKWYNDVYVPHSKARATKHHDHNDEGHGHDKGRDREHGRGRDQSYCLPCVPLILAMSLAPPERA